MGSLAIAVCITLIAALVVGASGCTNISNTNTCNTGPGAPSTSPTPDPVLEKIVNVTQQHVYGNSSVTVQAWNVTWNNDTSVTILTTVTGSFNGTNATASDNETLLSFPATQDATNFLNAFDKTNYSLTSTNYSSDVSASGTYGNATGHVPSVYKDYSYGEGSILTGSYREYSIAQLDNIIEIAKITITV